MLHKNRSHKRNQLKFLIVLPALVLFLMSFNTKEIYIEAETQAKEPSVILQKTNAIASANSNAKTLVTNNKPKAKSNHKTAKSKAKSAQDIVGYFIENSFTDAELDQVVAKLKDHGVTLKIKDVKRNGDNKIISIKIEAESKNSNANFSISNDSAIKTIKIAYNTKDDSISIGNSNSLILDKNNNIFTHEDGAFTIKKSKKGSNVFIQKNDDDHEIIEEDDKIIIKSGSKISGFKKGNKDENVFVISGGKGKKYEIYADTIKSNGSSYKVKGNVVYESKGNGKGFYISSGNKDEVTIELKSNNDDDNVMFISKDEHGNIIKEKIKTKKGTLTFKSKDGKTYKSKKTGKGSAIWVDKDNAEGKTITKIGKKGSIMFYTSDSDKKPLVVIDGKVVKNKKLEDIDPDSIESMTVLKGESAKKKYGRKAKNGVVEITSKEKND